MKILGIKQYGIKKYQAGTQGGGIQPQSQEGDTSEVIKEIVKGMIPIYGTYQDTKEFINNPTSENFGWMLASGIGDVLFFTGAGAGIKALKLARTANTARKALALKRSQKLLEAKKTFYDTRLARVAEESSRQNMKAALQRLQTVRNNYLLSQDKLKASERMLLGEAQKLGKSSLQDLTKDGIIQTTQVLTE